MNNVNFPPSMYNDLYGTHSQSARNTEPGTSGSRYVNEAASSSRSQSETAINARQVTTATPSLIEVKNKIHELYEQRFNKPFPSNESYLHQAINLNLDGNSMRVLMRNTVDIDAVNHATKERALIFAINTFNSEAVKLLLEHGANPKKHINDKNVNPLYLACKSNYRDVVELLLKHNATVNIGEDEKNPLVVAVTNLNLDITKLLLEYKADPNKARYYGDSLIKFVCQRSDNRAIEFVKLLLRHGAEVNTREGRKPLSEAVTNVNIPVAEMLLQHGADPNTRDSDAEPIFSELNSKSMKSEDVVALVKLLLKHNLQINMPGKYNPLLVAARYNRKDVAELLLQHGANPNVNTQTRWCTPLHYICVNNGDVEFARLLLKHNANILEPGQFDPLSAAVKHDRRDIMALFQRFY